MFYGQTKTYSNLKCYEFKKEKKREQFLHQASQVHNF